MKWSKRAQVYWISQLAGWGIFVLGSILSANMQGREVSHMYLTSLFVVVIGITITHGFRALIHKLGWKNLSILGLIPRILISSALLSLVFVILNSLVKFGDGHEIPIWQNMLDMIASARVFVFWQDVINLSALFLLWNMIYFAVSTYENWKREEIKNLELRAVNTEIELNSFKAQMNPHFMFNSMNSIRALIDEDPEKAKSAITTLSSLLRNSLIIGRNREASFREELDLVDKYLQLEKIRFEERLHIEMQIDSEILPVSFPPFMLQTIVENAVKHGISSRIEGGTISIQARQVNQQIQLMVKNSGQLKEINSGDGFGIANTQKRLQLMYGDQASFKIMQIDDEVVVQIEFPNQPQSLKI